MRYLVFGLVLAVVLAAGFLTEPGFPEAKAWYEPYDSVAFQFGTSGSSSDQRLGTITRAALPKQARSTLQLIRSHGPYPYRKDGTVFQNREKRLPLQPRGYYREYTVKTPGVGHRGARRIVAGSRGELYYTDDHYRSFRRIVE